MKAIDDSLGRILEALETRRVLERTVVIFTSDHGFFYGEHVDPCCLLDQRT